MVICKVNFKGRILAWVVIFYPPNFSSGSTCHESVVFEASLLIV